MRKFAALSCAFVLIMSLIGTSMAARVLTPTEPPEGVQIISIDEAKKLLDQRNVYVFDMRKEFNYSRGHIPSAVSLPYQWSSSRSDRTFDISELPDDKNSVIIFHDEGPDGWKPYYASKAARSAGYKNILWFRDGYSSWMEKGYAVEH